MPLSLQDLESQRSAIVRQLAELGDFRAGSITAISGRCGKPHCRCHRPHQPGHGPFDRLTYKLDGKTVSESLSTLAALSKAEREVAEFRRYQQLSRQFVDINAQICRLRPLAPVVLSPEEKKRSQQFSRKSRRK
jgi:hypothetical protein